jgi:hypothetical protein
MAGPHVAPLGLAAAPANFLVLEASTVAGRTLAAVQVYAGAPRVGLARRVEGTAARWAVTGSPDHLMIRAELPRKVGTEGRILAPSDPRRCPPGLFPGRLPYPGPSIIK